MCDGKGQALGGDSLAVRGEARATSTGINGGLHVRHAMPCLEGLHNEAIDRRRLSVVH